MSPEYLEVPCSSGETFRIKVKGLVYRNHSPFQRIEVFDTWDFGRCLVLDGVIQTAEKDHEVYDREILRKIRQSDRDLLILGGGDGYVAEMALRLDPEIRGTIVDLDREVAMVSSRHLSQTVFTHPGVRFIAQDATAYMSKALLDSFDGIVCDFTDFPVGYEDGRLREFYGAILGESAKVLRKSGWMSLYAGVYADRIRDLCESFFSLVERARIYVPSFGEPCTLIFCEGRKDLS